MQAKPPRPVINWGDPLARGLVAAWPMWERGGATVRDLAGRYDGTATSADVGWGVGAAGGCTSWGAAASNDAINCGTRFNPYALGTRHPLTIEAWCKPVAAADGTYNFLFSLESPGGSVRALSLARYTDTGAYANGVWLLLREEAAPSYKVCYIFSAAGTAAPGALYQVVGVYSGLTTSPQIALYVNGSPTAIGSSNLIDLELDNLTYTMGIGAEPNLLTRGWSGDIASVRLWKRALSAREVAQLYADPWRMYRRPRPVRYRTVTAATATGRWYYDLTSRRRRA